MNILLSFTYKIIVSLQQLSESETNKLLKLAFKKRMEGKPFALPGVARPLGNLSTPG